MRSIHFKFPEALFLRIEAQRKKDRLSPDRSEFIRRLLDMQLTRLEEKTQRRPSVVPANVPPQSVQAAAAPEPESGVVWTNAPGGPRAIEEYTIEIEMPDGSIVRGVPKNASPELLARRKAEGTRQPAPARVAGGSPTNPAATKSEELEEPADLGDASSARAALANLLDE